MTRGPERWACPSCGAEYEVPPKWCPCQPYPVGEPHVFYFLLALEGEADERDHDLPIDLAPLSAAAMRARARATLVACLEGPAAWRDESDAPPGGAAADLARRLIHQATARRERLGGSLTGLVLVREAYEPHVETTDYWSWTVVDVSPEEFEALLAAYRAEHGSPDAA